MFGRFLLVFLFPALLAAGGCARSGDGTVVIPKPLDVRRIWDKPPPHAQTSQSQVGVFPVAPPQAPARSAARRLAPPPTRARRVTSAPAPLTSSDPAAVLACRNVSKPGTRYRVVCE
ncbi:hypothetical protein [Mesorhizobium amorphae]|uniref:hypothetical protein n=1 Tax=Mesorhizobium amorphae TaxID=71433 RepID=UPI000A2F5F08|nr:hypothetical protein [Mesorhizobium amorphae]GLR41921.1 hypothetical protein GCM10007880_24370 [Mesorhizobium amorphae]